MSQKLNSHQDIIELAQEVELILGYGSGGGLLNNRADRLSTQMQWRSKSLIH